MMTDSSSGHLVAFESHDIRRVWHREEWWFSVIDVVGALSESTNARRYWSDLKRKIEQEQGGNELYEKIVQLKMQAPDGKSRVTDCANTETMLRIIQSVPSPKAEPFKLWLARVGYERVSNQLISKFMCNGFRAWQLQVTSFRRKPESICERSEGKTTRVSTSTLCYSFWPSFQHRPLPRVRCFSLATAHRWIPAFAGMTTVFSMQRPLKLTYGLINTLVVLQKLARGCLLPTPPREGEGAYSPC